MSNNINPGLNIKAFESIANGTHNVGEISLNNAGTGLAKVNNHVFKTSQNNVRLTAEQNRQVRNALMNAFRNDKSLLYNLDVLYEIEDQLLGGGRDTCSLSRDYVRHLISAAHDKSGNRLENVRKAGTLGTRLLDRNIAVKDTRTDGGARLVKSTKAAAYELTVNEQVDREVLKARNALSNISFSLEDVLGAESVGRSYNLNRKTALFSKMTKATALVNKGISALLDADPAVSAEAKESINAALKELIKGKDEMAMRSSLAERPNMGPKFLAHLERQIRLAYQNAGVADEVVESHLERIFPKEEEPDFKEETMGKCKLDKSTLKMFGEIENASGLHRQEEAKLLRKMVKEGFFRVGQGLVSDIQEIRDLRTNFLLLLRAEVINAREYPNDLCENIGRVISKNDHPSLAKTRGNQFEKAMRDPKFDWTNGLKAAEKLEELLTADLDAIFKGLDDDYKECLLKRFNRCGLGV